MKLYRPTEECGIFGIYGHPEAANLTYLGLYALQHRGQEACGIVSSDGRSLYTHRSMGLVADVFGNQEIFGNLPGESAIGHVRYSTTGDSVLKNVQPIKVDYSRGSIAIAHNGNLVNAQYIKDELEAWGSIFQTTMDTEVILHLLATSKHSSLEDRIIDALGRIKGAYCLLFLTETRMVAARDPHGFRPLCLGKLGDAWVVASESCALDLIEAEFVREIEPGEIVVITKDGLTSHFPHKKIEPAPCIFEFVYFARPDSYIFGKNVYQVRKDFGRQLCREHRIDADIVIPVPDSGVPAALGYAQEAGIPFELGLIRNHYVGRTFIEPQQSIRHFGVKIKLNPVREVLKGKRVVVIDDSIVRGTTSRKIVKMVRNAGASEVHVRISSPPTSYPCYYGIDTPTRKELISSSHTIEEIRKYITADSLGYLSEEGLLQAVGAGSNPFCKACFSGGYPITFPRLMAEPQLDLF
ncbi:amidophosphoribosyltransferase [Geobacter sulfurreducens]|uniref:Amidophosphoribosyltransferase n=1 Tax=Geobacter sulfurreducens (strain ATCC 51573 / DSM 12127 / PCA) TaxID=243231 RepID=Q74CN7_GEOSL|nr:amidophosphoribosyltransferase [Geobacter sulfurreducens]AAR35010.2 glutamine--phosphoribosylpyrophosphate amidotransferase [Geobacter sulfurreducens PCA]ADI84471.1 glutamine--phosphoribosylpyrophosphate amidotransferase [Geobacter sulfurreducens KN400]AJY71483.1 amidophosphoribosyltransferase [Geobacter sulfurreducens]QVW36798.1 amidophosphoribosyltransferase [Geobacter sulfurreducens]UAC05813.1 amidophosphoribosyltransferase [Geobacter sulfurreducens]